VTRTDPAISVVPIGVRLAPWLLPASALAAQYKSSVRSGSLYGPPLDRHQR
jgi:hypothetical protein